MGRIARAVSAKLGSKTLQSTRVSGSKLLILVPVTPILQVYRCPKANPAKRLKPIQSLMCRPCSLGSIISFSNLLIYPCLAKTCIFQYKNSVKMSDGLVRDGERLQLCDLLMVANGSSLMILVPVAPRANFQKLCAVTRSGGWR